MNRGIDVLVCNSEPVKTGLDLLEFPAIVFMQSGYSVYTVLRASRRSCRIGQKQAVDVYYLGYAETAQIDCHESDGQEDRRQPVHLGRHARHRAGGVLNQDGDSLEIALARRLSG